MTTVGIVGDQNISDVVFFEKYQKNIMSIIEDPDVTIYVYEKFIKCIRFLNGQGFRKCKILHTMDTITHNIGKYERCEYKTYAEILAFIKSCDKVIR